MVNRVVATKLTDEEHTKLLDLCNKEGCTPSAFIKNALLEKIMPKQEKSEEFVEELQKKDKHTLGQMMRDLKIKNNADEAIQVKKPMTFKDMMLHLK